MAWPEGSLPWRIAGWFLLALGLGFLNYRLVMRAMSRAAADAKQGLAKITPWYLVRMFTNFSMMLLAFFIDGNTYVLLAVMAGLLIMTGAMVVSRLRTARVPVPEAAGNGIGRSGDFPKEQGGGA